MTIGFILIIIITRYLRRTQKDALSEKWHQVLKGLMIAAIAFLIIELPFKAASNITMWIAHGMLLYIVYILYKEKEFSGARQVLFAITPYVLISFFNDIVEILNKQLYSTLSGWLDTGTVFAIIWMVAMLFITNRQKKALEKEKLKVKQEEEQNRIISQMKADLEVQVAERTSELTRQKEELEHALHDLRATQDQLIQAEKMASLGELTAGIAHEIQNPLNFINNFSEVNSELIDEMDAEIAKGNTEEIKAVANDIKQNMEKIIYHGKRADAIVKGMLQHSRKSTGQKEPTDINNLADEYLRLSYHGLRAKEKSFNASFKTDFDKNIGPVNVVPQDIGRVFLNLINNAFYAVSEKKEQNPGISYEPTVSIKTKKTGNRVEITVKDNGNGIPQNIIDKIFQPFFTTKPTGQGTGLGLSLSYDIVTKGHNGELKVQSKEGEGAGFIISLPLK
ncbi:MAG: GHKL domain-containing protein [Bacteroidetes bacterium]|nr:GHKL domain-containing protein [Bacteroidota bacterium]